MSEIVKRRETLQIETPGPVSRDVAFAVPVGWHKIDGLAVDHKFDLRRDAQVRTGQATNYSRLDAQVAQRNFPTYPRSASPTTTTEYERTE